MATSRAVANPGTSDWVDVTGSAGSVAKVMWQNQGPGLIQIAFNASKPDGAVAFATLPVFGAYYDVTGSAKIWARSLGNVTSQLTAISD